MSNTSKLPCGSIVINNQTTYGTLENLYTIDLEKGLVCAKHFLEDMKIARSIEAINMEFNFDIIPIYQVNAMDYFHSITKQPFVKPLDILLLLTLAKDKYYIKTTRDFICSTLIPFINKNKIKHDDFKKETVMSKITPTENQSQKFHSDLFGDLTVLTHTDGSLWFIGKEVAEKLGYSRPSDAITQHCKGAVKHRIKLNQYDTVGNDMLVIPERDVYRLVMRSKLPTAEQFEEFVVSEVLPSIRKTGGYQQEQQVGYDNALKLLGVPTEIVPTIAKVYEERDDAIKTKAWISSKREASAMGKLARANDKIKQLTMVAKLESNLLGKVSHATILAIQSRVKDLKANGLKLANFCRRKGLEVKQVDDVRFGRVNSYPAEAWRDVYNVDINSILGV